MKKLPRRVVAKPEGPLRAALYMRVSTGRQAQHDLSIPDQRWQAADYCARQGWNVVAEFVDAGLSGQDENRPEFARMLDMATGGGAPFDVIVVHSFSRFARDLLAVEFSVRRLARHGIDLVSISQPLEKGPHNALLRQIIASFDEHTSQENRKHTSRAMMENARQGFWNGSTAPYGYRIVAAEQRGTKTKKRLAVDEVEAETVRLMFRLYLHGDGQRGPMGVKAIVSFLNERGHWTRKGAKWGVGPLHAHLTSTTYIGEFRYNRIDSRTREVRSEAEHIIVPVEPIIDRATFDAVQASLKSRNPKVTPPRISSGSKLLTGIATCASCGGGMTLRTGKSGAYQYYACASAAQKGKTACKGRAIRMDRLDGLVTERLADRLFTPERVGKLLCALVERQTARGDDHARRMTAFRTKLIDAENRLSRLYQAIETGIADPHDSTLKDRIAAIKTERDIAQVTLDRALAEMSPQTRVTAEKIAAFTETMRKNIVSGDVPFRKAYIQAVIDQIEVDDTEIRIHGRKTVLERLVMASGAAPAGVPSFVRKWRTRQDSNL